MYIEWNIYILFLVVPYLFSCAQALLLFGLRMFEILWLLHFNEYLFLYLGNHRKVWWLMYIEIIMKNKYELTNIWFQVKSHLLRCLSIGDNHIIHVPNTGEEFTVTLIDANHCPGSVMFLFQGEDTSACFSYFFSAFSMHIFHAALL